MRYYMPEIKRGILSVEFVISILLFICVAILNCYFNIYSAGKTNVGGLTVFIHSTVVGYSAFSYLAPLIGALPACSKFWLSVSHGYIKQELLRINRKRYICMQIVHSLIIGGAVYIIAGTIFLGVCVSANPIASVRLLSMQYISSYKYIYAKSLLQYCIVIIMNAAMFGASYSLLTTGVLCWCHNRIIALTIVTAFYVGSTLLNGTNILGIPVLPCGTFVMLVSEIATIKDHILVLIIGATLLTLGINKKYNI